MLNLLVLNDSHVRDRTETTDSYIYTFAEDPAGTWTYDEELGTFTSGGAGGYTRTATNIKLDSVANEGDIEAVVRTTEVINQQFAYNINVTDVFVKQGIAKQMLANGSEETAKLDVYEDGANISNMSGQQTEYVLYKDDYDVNEDVDTARLNGVRNFIASPDIPISMDVSKAFSIQFTLTNEGRIFDMLLITSNRAEVE